MQATREMDGLDELVKSMIGTKDEMEKAAERNKKKAYKLVTERSEPQHLCLMYPEEVLNITLKTSAKIRCVRCVRLCAA
jgi:hypothetical protein